MAHHKDNPDNPYERLPKPPYQSVDHLIRTRNQMLGIPYKAPPRSLFPIYGYTSEDKVDYAKLDEGLHYPVEFLFKTMCEAKVNLKTYSYDDVAAWLSAKTGKKLSTNGLHKYMTYRQPADDIIILDEDGLFVDILDYEDRFKITSPYWPLLADEPVNGLPIRIQEHVRGYKESQEQE